MALRVKARQKDDGDSSGYRRRAKPVPVRTGLRDWRNWPWKGILSLVFVAAVCAGAYYGVSKFLAEDERFRLAQKGLVVTGLETLDEASVRNVFQSDLGVGLTSIPLEKRRAALGDLPWVRSATVVRLWPNRIWVDIAERRPVAYVRVADEPGGPLKPRLIDSEGVFLGELAKQRVEAPVLDGIDAEMPVEERRIRVELFERLMTDLDSETPKYSERISQIDVADPQNARIVTVRNGDVIELQMGDELFRHRFEVFEKYIDSWKGKYGTVAWVDLRLENQVVVRPLTEVSQARGK